MQGGGGRGRSRDIRGKEKTEKNLNTVSCPERRAGGRGRWKTQSRQGKTRDGKPPGKGWPERNDEHEDDTPEHQRPRNGGSIPLLLLLFFCFFVVFFLEIRRQVIRGEWVCQKQGGAGWRKVRVWRRHLGKWDEKPSQGLEGRMKSPAELGGRKLLAALPCTMDGLSGPHPSSPGTGVKMPRRERSRAVILQNR